jgi:phage N-6-adenine-methyltransferase
MARRAAGLRQATLALEIGLSVPSVRQAERGLGAVDTFERVAGRLGLRLDGDLPPSDTLGSRLAALRGRRGWSRRTLAIAAGISPTTLAALEHGASVNLTTIGAVAEALGTRFRLVPVGSPPSFWMAAGISSVHHGWTTPPEILERLYGVVGGAFGLDPCSPTRAGPNAHVRARLRYAAEDDALSLPWRTPSVFMNPPYGRALRLWVAKARAEAEAGRAGVVVGLVPARCDTGWWHQHVAGAADIWMLRGRLSFGDGSQPAPFPSAIVIWSAAEVHRARMTLAFPDAWYVGART